MVAFVLVVLAGGASAMPRHAAPPSQADRMKAVVREWNTNLYSGNNAAEARLFSLPATISLIGGGPVGCYCLTSAEVAQFHAQWLCSNKIVSITAHGRYVTTVLRLSDREFSKCDNRGALLGMRFTIVRGKITVMKQTWWKPPDGCLRRASDRSVCAKR
jgi:hypothetical protein